MGLVSHTRGLQTRISVVPSANRHKANFSPERQFTYYRSRSGRLIKKRRNRESSISREKFRFLQHIFPCPQEKWENETHHKSETPQQVSSEDSFQNGHIVKGLKSSEARRLGHIFRSERCLSARANFLETQEVPSVLCKQKMLPVQSVMLRTNLCPEGIHQVGSRSSSTFTTAKCQTSIVSRRLVSFESSQKVSSSRSREMPKSVDFTRLYCQQRKVLLDPDSNNNIHRGLVQSRAGKSVSNSRESRETDISSQSNANQAKCNCQRIFTSFGTDSILSGTNSKCTPLHEANSTSSSKFLETKLFGFDTGDSSYKTSKITSHMVVRYSKHYQGQIITASTDKGNHNDRCFENRVWRLPGQSVLSGELVSCSKETTYKYPGVGSSFSHSETFSSRLEGSECLDSVRLNNCGTISEQTRRHQVSTDVLQDMGSLELGNRERDLHQSSSHFRGKEQDCRPSEQEQSIAHGMDIEQVNSFEAVPFVGSSNDRSLCVSRESTGSNILFMVSSSPSSSSGCSNDLVGQHVCICISPSLPGSKSSATHAIASMSNHSDCTTVAQKTLVHRTSSTSGRHSSKTTSTSKSVTSTKKQSKSPESRGLQLDCVASLNRSFKEKGFSKQARQLLTASWRKGTQKDYTSKFKKFCSWCRTRKIDPYSASLTQVADFLSDLFADGLQYRTIAGYRSMLSSVLSPVNNTPVGQHPYIIRLLKGVFHSRPPKTKLLPEWDLQMVLNMLQKEPFEPLSEASLKLTTYKAVFLMAISTFRRCSDLQSLRLGEGSVSVQKKGVTFIRHGLSKQDRQTHYGSKVFVPAFPENKKLDPKRALYFYLKKTDSLRLKTDGTAEVRVFLSVKEPHQAVSAQTISKWIVKTIRLAYNDSALKVKGHSTRAIGPSWALYNGASIRSILEAADWKKESTFIQFYFRNVDVEVLKQ